MTTTKITAEKVVRGVTRSEIFAGLACALSTGTLIFSLGVTYQQVQSNSVRIERVEAQVGGIVPDLAVMRTDIKYLVEQEQRRQRREDSGK